MANRPLNLACAALLLSSGLLLTQRSIAQTITHMQEPSGVLSLDAQASAEVPADVVQITLFYEQQAGDPATLTRTLNERTARALARTRSQQAVQVKTGAFNISPASDRDGKISGWRGRSELILQSKDFEAASALAGSLGDSMQVASVDFSLSPEAQRTAQSALSTQAIEAFRARAQAASVALGYRDYTIREVNLGGNGLMMHSKSAPRLYAAAANRDAVPIEAGTTTVAVSVNGSVQMTR